MIEPLRTRPELTRSLSWVASMACWDETASKRSTRYRSFVCAPAPISLISRTCTSGFEFTSPPFIAAIAFGVRFTTIEKWGRGVEAWGEKREGRKKERNGGGGIYVWWGKSKKKGRRDTWVVGGEKKGKEKRKKIKIKRWCTWVVGKKGKKKKINNVMIKTKSKNQNYICR